MNFKNFYNNTENRLRDAILSLWATGDATTQQYFSAILKKEGLLAEPIFQNAFPWQASGKPFRETNTVFSNEFIKGLDKVKEDEYRFPSDRFPYKHQVESWDALINQYKSIAVTTGTGSGKTECFMLPVLYDIYTNCKDSNGTNAIFLYPLNALIGSQKKRIDAWCRALGGIRYAVYNGNTAETAKANVATQLLPELISRKQIRETPPQILFTNPSMLEYILVRNKDVQLLKNSEGKLRWILLDEAHTLTGSSAAEMALLIRRIVDAFKVDINKLRFAITSATVGSGENSENQLKKFMANLCGISIDQIQVIGGQRFLPQLPTSTNSQSDFAYIKQSASPEQFKAVMQLRLDLITNSALSLSNIGKRFNTNNIQEPLELIDFLSERSVDAKSILPVRGHFFARGISGVYVCTNPECAEHKNYKPETALGSMTTIAGRLCNCGSPLLELVACRSCGNQLIEGERFFDNNGDAQIRLVSALTQDAFLIEREDDDDNEDEPIAQGRKFYFTKNLTESKFINQQHLTHFSISLNGNIIQGDAFVEADRERQSICPHCGEQTNNPIHFRLSSSFINRILADIFLEETPEAETQTIETLWRGHKYISFTDSRQGTAKVSALINQDNEASWIRSQVYHKLCEKRKELTITNTLSDSEKQGLIDEKIQLENQLSSLLPILQNAVRDRIKVINGTLGNSLSVPKISITWKELKNYLNPLKELYVLFRGNNPNDNNPNAKSHYLTAILYDQFARRLPRERSLENLGMISLAYPKLQNIAIPSIAESLSITLDEWKSLLKIAVDYIIRYQFHFSINSEIYPYSTTFLRSHAIYNPDSDEVNAKKWPTFDRHYARPNRLALLVCAGLGHTEREDIDNELEDRINELLDVIWRTIKVQVLSIDGSGFILNLEEASQFQLPETLWLCPVKRRLIDVHFRNYSPWIKGALTEENIRHYKIEKAVQFPDFPYPFNLNEEKNLDVERTRKWIEENAKILREQGVWNNIHERIILQRPLYLSGEHSAQQDEKRLKDLENKFEKSEINILNCSTTMEMGVDIGGISTVVMNNVPPGPANYLQRAGRAGRRSEVKSLAFTICAPNPVGMSAMDNPMWALAHEIAPPFLSFNSEAVVERHIKAFFLGKFVQTDAISGLNVKDKIDTFFFREDQSLAELFTNWLLSNEVFIYDSAIKSIVNNTPLKDKTFSYLLNRTILSFQNLSDKTINKKGGFDDKLSSLAQEFGDDSPAYKAVSFQKLQFLNKNAIGYLAEEGFLPTSGLPTGIVEFDTLNIDDLNKKNTNKSKPSYFITRALSEFAPGNRIVIDGKSYTSEGIILQNDRGVQAEKEIIQSCSRCGFQRIIEVANNENVDDKCPHCKENAFVGLNFSNPEILVKFTEMIQPAGFATDIYETPSRKISETSNVQYVDPLLINIRPWSNTSNALFDLRESEGNAEILFYNKGSGDGYAVCLHCGRTAFTKEALEGHKRLRGGKSNDNNRNPICLGNDNSYSIRENVILGGRFKTDFCEIRFRKENGRFSNDQTLLYSLGSILTKELAAYLAINENEIGFGLKRYEQFATVFIFDKAKGGAGYASQFALYADTLFKNAKEKLDRCTCEVACTKCLIDRHTQWHINNLDRHLAVEWLKNAVNIQVPEKYLEIIPQLKPVIGSIKDEIGRLIYANKINEIWLYVSSEIQAWDFEKISFVDKLKSKIKINLVLLNANQSILTNQDKISLIQVSSWAAIYYLTTNKTDILKTLCKILTDDGQLIEYVSEDFEKILNENWGNTTTGFIYKNPNSTLEKLQSFKINIDSGSVFEAVIDEGNPISSNKIAELLLDKLVGKIELRSIMKSQSFEILYNDRYLKTQFGCILMVQFINRLKQLLSFDIHSFTFKGKDFWDERSPYYLFHSYQNADDRNDAVEEFAEQMGIPRSQALNDNLPHYRYFEFTNDKIKITIRPDAGIEYGWNLSPPYSNVFNKQIESSHIWTIQKKNTTDLLYTLSIDYLNN